MTKRRRTWRKSWRKVDEEEEREKELVEYRERGDK